MTLHCLLVEKLGFRTSVESVLLHEQLLFLTRMNTSTM
jgi:hypothetical protein